MESPSLRPPGRAPTYAEPTAPHWSRTPRFWLAAMAVAALVLAVASGVEAIRIQPIRVGFGICAVTFLLAAVGCGGAALTTARRS